MRKEYSEQNYRHTGRKCIADYYNRYTPFSESRTLGLEQIILIEIEGYKLKGFIDRLAQKSDGYYEIHDYKTSQYMPPLDHLKKDRQLALYQLAVEDMWRDARRVDLVWHYLVHGKEIRINKQPGELEELKAEFIALIQEIESAEEEEEFPARKSSLCTWCEFQPLCPSRAHILKTEQLPKNEFLEEPGVKLVNRYAAMVRRRREFNHKLKKLKQALTSYAREEGVGVVAGSDVEASVKIGEVLKYPKKKEVAREKLERLIKDAGLWDELSDLNPHALAKKVDSGELDQELLEKIQEYQRVEEVRNCYK